MFAKFPRPIYIFLQTKAAPVSAAQFFQRRFKSLMDTGLGS